MGFCRRCGEIVPTQTTRCKCGGSSVAPVVQWTQNTQKGSRIPDRWAETYVSNDAEREENHSTPITHTERSTSSPPKSSQEQGSRHGAIPSPSRGARRFPRPLSTNTSSSAFTDSRISQHIASATGKPIVSPTKHNPVLNPGDSPGSTPSDVITSPDNATLAKAYGSVLQPPETLPIHTCASCSTVFLPDATIYPDPQASSDTVSRFLCRSCFAIHGGSKGPCASCGRDVLTVTKEGGFVQSAGKVWHKRCFRCGGCDKDIGHAPMVDLLGRPSCAECFDTCLDEKRSPKTIKKSEPYNNIGGLRGRSRESSPALEELTEKLGIARLSASEPTRDLIYHAAFRSSVSPSGRMRDSNASEDISTGSWPTRGEIPPHTPSRKPLAPIKSATSSPDSIIEPSTPDLSSTSNSVSSRSPSTPSNSPVQSFAPSSRESITPKAKGTLGWQNIVTTNDAKCNRCSRSLFNIAGGGKIVTVPAENSNEEPTSFHASCFHCFVCGNSFDQDKDGQAMFLSSSRGPCHPKCSVTSTHVSENRLDRQKSGRSNHSPDHSPERPPVRAPPFTRVFPRFGSSETCPGCCRPVSLMEYGVVPGPQNTRWHGNCLVCGGKGSGPPRPGCGKKLDSGAKTDRGGKVWCRECMLLLPAGACPSPQGSPTRGRLSPSYTGTGLDRFPRPPEAGRLFGQVTGNTVLKSDALMMQLTGGGPGQMRRGSVSPTRPMMRSVSPTKGLMSVTKHPRPLGTWRHKSVDEGRGMFLVRQMTGNGL